MKAILATIACLLLLPFAAAGPGHTANDSAEVKLFIHPTGDDFVLSPIESYWDGSQALPGPDLACTVVAGSLGQESTVFIPFSRAEVAGSPPGYTGGETLARLLDLDTAKGFKLFWTVEAVLGGQPYPAAIPQVVIDANLRSGPAGEGGDILAGGTTGEQIFSNTAATSVVRYHQVGDRHVYDIQIAMQKGSITTADAVNGFHLEITTSMTIPGCENGSFMLPFFAHYSDPDHRSFVRLAPYDPVLIGTPQIVVDETTATISANISSPFGVLDVPADLLSLEVRGPTPATTVSLLPVDVSGPAGMDEYVATFVWDHAADNAQNATYGVTVFASNLGQSFTKDNSATFRIGGLTNTTDKPVVVPPPAKESPGLALPVLVGVVATLAVLRRRQ